MTDPNLDFVRRYRKKPVVIEAAGPITNENARNISNWCGGVVWVYPVTVDVAVITIPTLEGEMEASPGDYVIRGVKGEFYPCKPDIFDATYEPTQLDGSAGVS